MEENQQAITPSEGKIWLKSWGNESKEASTIDWVEDWASNSARERRVA